MSEFGGLGKLEDGAAGERIQAEDFQVREPASGPLARGIGILRAVGARVGQAHAGAVDDLDGAAPSRHAPDGQAIGGRGRIRQRFAQAAFG